MPLLDHFHPPLELTRQWGSFHSMWASQMAAQLNGSLLPAGYHAEPHVTFGSRIEVDVAAFETEAGQQSREASGSVATEVYAPPQPPLTVAVDFADIDTIEVKIYREEGGLQLVAAVELVSPSNKDRSEHRAAFVRKCATYLQERVALVIVDVVTSRGGNFHAELVALLSGGSADPAVATALYAAAYRTRVAKQKAQVEGWPMELELGKVLPTLPLWLASDLVVPLNLESTYLQTCEALRIRAVV